VKPVRQLLPILFAIAALVPAAAHAQDAAQAQAQDQAQTETIFTPGTGTGQDSAQTGPIAPQPAPIPQKLLACAEFPAARQQLNQLYGPHFTPFAAPELADGVAAPDSNPTRLDRALFDVALDSYSRHHCHKPGSQGFGPSRIVVVDFAKPSSQPRLYVVDLTTGQGLDSPVEVAHGIGSDRDDDGIADQFSNVYMSLASSLGAARGAELYHGANGLSLRLDGLDHTNSQMRIRDIVAHSYQPQRRRYFNSSLLSARAGKPGTSEGCFVVAPHLRDWLFDALRDGGFLFAGLGGNRIDEMRAVINPPLPRHEGEVIFVQGTGN
jgi:hypothetical protein